MKPRAEGTRPPSAGPRPRTEPAWRRYLRFFRPSVQGDVDDEIRFHFESRIEELVARGLSPEAARAQALEEFGDVDTVRERLTEIGRRLQERRKRADWWEGVWEDVRVALRGLRRAPGLTATVVITLALGIGANAALFSLLDRVFLRVPDGVADAEHVRRVYVRMHVVTPDGTTGIIAAPSFSYPQVVDLQTALGSSAALAPYMTDSVRLGRGDDAPYASAVHAGPGYFRLLGVRPAVGRFFAPDEERVEAPGAVVVLSHAFWQRRFGGDAGVLGRTIDLEWQRVTVIGVAQPQFTGVDLDAADVWLPLGVQPLEGGPQWYRSRRFIVLQLLARIPRSTDERSVLARATTAIRRPSEALQSEELQMDSTAVAMLGPLIAARGPGERQKEVTISTRLAGVAAIVLLIACANVANLLLARGVQRRRETAVRAALGASRGRLVRLLLTESLLLTLLAAGAAVAVGAWGGAALRALLFPGTHWAGGALDWRLVGFAALAAVVTGVLAGLAPALRASRPDVTAALKGGAREGTVQRSRLRTVLVVTQAALSVVLLVGAGLFVRSLGNVRALDIGYDAERLVFVSVFFDGALGREAALTAGMERAAQHLARVPGVERTALASMAPMRGFIWLDLFLRKGDRVPPSTGLKTYTAVSPDYFAATGLRLLRGRGFGPDDRAGAPPVLVVNEAMARTLWPGAEALGQCLRLGKPTNPCATVVGVVEDARLGSVIERRPASQYYVPLAQAPDPRPPSVILVRAPPARSAAIAAEARRAVRELVPDAEPHIIRMADYLAPQFRPWRLGATLFSLFGVLALVVAAVGVYGTVAYTVRQRTPEFGVRIALGARSRDVLRLVVGEGVRVVAAGVLAGVALALALGRVVSSLLYGVSPRDPAVMGSVALALLGVAAIACLVPAWRAARVDPVEALRAE